MCAQLIEVYHFNVHALSLLICLVCYRLIADSWLELKFPSAEVGERVVGVVQTLRA